MKKGQQKTQSKGSQDVTAEDLALQTSTYSPANATLGLNLLGVGIGFNGYSVPDAPTDANLAVGDTQVVEWVNVSYAVFNKTTGAVEAGPILGNALWAGFDNGPNGTDHNMYEYLFHVDFVNPANSTLTGVAVPCRFRSHPIHWPAAMADLASRRRGRPMD